MPEIPFVCLLAVFLKEKKRCFCGCYGNFYYCGVSLTLLSSTVSWRRKGKKNRFLSIISRPYGNPFLIFYSNFSLWFFNGPYICPALGVWFTHSSSFFSYYSSNMYISEWRGMIIFNCCWRSSIQILLFNKQKAHKWSSWTVHCDYYSRSIEDVLKRIWRLKKKRTHCALIFIIFGFIVVHFFFQEHVLVYRGDLDVNLILNWSFSRLFEFGRIDLDGFLMNC